MSEATRITTSVRFSYGARNLKQYFERWSRISATYEAETVDCFHELQEYLAADHINHDTSSSEANLPTLTMLKELRTLANGFLTNEDHSVETIVENHTTKVILAFAIILSGWEILGDKYPNIQREVNKLRRIYIDQSKRADLRMYLQGLFMKAERIRLRYNREVKPYKMPFDIYKIYEVVSVLYFYELMLLKEPIVGGLHQEAIIIIATIFKHIDRWGFRAGPAGHHKYDAWRLKLFVVMLLLEKKPLDARESGPLHVPIQLGLDSWTKLKILIESFDDCFESDMADFKRFLSLHKSWFPAYFRGNRDNLSSFPKSAGDDIDYPVLSLIEARKLIQVDAEELREHLRKMYEAKRLPRAENFRLATQKALMGLNFLFPYGASESSRRSMTSPPDTAEPFFENMWWLQHCLSVVVSQRFFSDANVSNHPQHKLAFKSLRMMWRDYFKEGQSFQGIEYAQRPVKLVVRPSTIDCLYLYFGCASFPVLFESRTTTDLIEHVLFLVNVLDKFFVGDELSAMKNTISTKLNSEPEDKKWFEAFRRSWTDDSTVQPTNSSSSELRDRTSMNQNPSLVHYTTTDSSGISQIVDSRLPSRSGNGSIGDHVFITPQDVSMRGQSSFEDVTLNPHNSTRHVSADEWRHSLDHPPQVPPLGIQRHEQTAAHSNEPLQLEFQSVKTPNTYRAEQCGGKDSNGTSALTASFPIRHPEGKRKRSPTG